MKTFKGYERKNGLIGIRNHVAVIPTVSCANGVVSMIANEVNGVVPLYHGHGCGRGPELVMHQRVLAGLAVNPNVSAVLLVGLGCETIKADVLADLIAKSGKPVEYLVIQQEGGSRKTAAKGIEIVKKMLAYAEKQEKKTFSFDRITLGLECGGSDAFSGVSANPCVGLVSDWIVDQGGTVILTETTEMIGTTHILEKRALNEEVAQKIKNVVCDAQKRASTILGEQAARVISPGNMDGGMSTIQEKALGCIEKGGHRTINNVLEYGEFPCNKGLCIMDGPGYDVESLPGLAAAGAQLIIFTTGRGNPIGFPTVPVIKVASNSRLYASMEDDMDVNAGVVLEGKSLDELAKSTISLVKEVLNGKETKAEINKQGGIVCPWTLYPSF